MRKPRILSRPEIPANKHAARFIKLTKPCVVYKKAWDHTGRPNRLVTLRLPKDTVIYNSYHKRRATQAKVLKVQRLKWVFAGGNLETKLFAGSVAYSGGCRRAALKQYRVTYKKGLLVKPRGPDGDVDSFSYEFEECRAGIHFFLTLKEALDY